MSNWMHAIAAAHCCYPDAYWLSPSPLLLCVVIVPFSVALAVASVAYLRHDEEEEAAAEVESPPTIPTGRMSTARWLAERFVPCALEVAVRDRIPVCTAALVAEQNVGCVVCLTPFQSQELLMMLPPCHHAFHVACIYRWFEEHSTCPICRCQVSAPATANADVRVEVVERTAKTTQV